MPAEGRENPLLKKGNSDAFFREKYLTKNTALLDYKFSLLHEKGELVNPMYIRKSDFLKDDLGDYDDTNHFEYE